MSSSGGTTPTLVKPLAWLVLTLMAVAVAYTAWIAIVNFGRIGV